MSDPRPRRARDRRRRDAVAILVFWLVIAGLLGVRASVDVAATAPATADRRVELR